MGKVVGIDLGTTFSAIAHVNECGQPEIIPNAEKHRTTSSVILFKDGSATIGNVAKQYAKSIPKQVVEFVKREMGKSKEKFSRTFDGKDYSAEELSSLILTKLKKDAEIYLNTEITDAVITVPAYFRDAERQATRNAGKIAGLNVRQVLNEPTAAALAYGIDQLGYDQTVLVFDLGGGTFDVTVMKVSGSKIEMIATNGDHRLGGKDWDDKIIIHVAKMFEIEHGENPLQDLRAYQSLQHSAVNAKIRLSHQEKVSINCKYKGNITHAELTREKFEELTAELLEKCRALCDIVLSEGNMTWADIDRVLLVGGSTRMPMVQEMITNISGKKINPHEVDPDEIVALGAALQGTLHQISESDDATTDVPDAVVERFFKHDRTPKVTVTDGATHNFGLVVLNSLHEPSIHVMIPKMTPIPCEKEEDSFRTVEDNQRSVLIEVVQGLEQGQLRDEIDSFEDYKLGECTLELPQGLPEGSPVRIIYAYNLHQLLEVTATALSSSDAKGIFDLFSVIIKRPTLDAEEVAQAQTYLQGLAVK